MAVGPNGGKAGNGDSKTSLVYEKFSYSPWKRESGLLQL